MVRIGICDCSMNSISRSAELVGVGVEPQDDAGRDLKAVAVERRDRLEHRQRRVLILAHAFQRIEVRRFDADKDGDERRLAHQRQHVGLLGDIERRLAGEIERITVALLPRDEVMQDLRAPPSCCR